MSHYFTYEYNFDLNDSEIIVHVSYAFDTISELETISTYPHRERRDLAMSLMAKYPADSYCKLTIEDITSPFAQRLQQLFQGNFKVYWTNRFTRAGVTLVFLTGLGFIFI